jgi:AraC-like DNA-binding protein
MLFSTRDLDAPVVTSDPSLRPYTRRFLDTVVAPSDPTLAAQVAETVELLLPLGRSSLEQVAGRLGLAPRVLQRHLAEEGGSFSSVVHETRARLAERYLSNGRYSLTEISALLGFAAPSAFSRWFHERFGSSPREWRRAAHPEEPAARTQR